MYATGDYTMKEVASSFPVSYVAINNLLKRHGFKAKSQSALQRKYPLQESFFDSIDTQEKAYFLGILYADGYNNRERNSVTLSLKESDKNILVRLNDLIQPNKPLQFVDVSNTTKTPGYENTTNQYRLVIASKHISQQLAKLGCGAKKTFNLIFPNENILPFHLQSHFVRGYFDGDGCIGFRNKRGYFSMVGTLDFLSGIERFFARVGINVYWRNDEKYSKIKCLEVSGRQQILKCCEVIYQDSSLHLKRKFDVYHNLKSVTF